MAQIDSSTASRAIAGSRPQFGLKTIFAFTAWTAAIAGLAVSQFSCWTMFAVGLSLVCLNCWGRLVACQRRSGQARCIQAGWLLLAVSLFLPAMKGCNNTSIVGWEAARASLDAALHPPSEISHETGGYLLVCLSGVANVLLAFSPLFLWRLRRGKGAYYGLLLFVAVPAMWCFGDPAQVLIGYYVWCAGGLAILCAFPMRWAMLPLLAIAPTLAYFGHRGNSAGAAARPANVSATTTRSAS